MEVLERKEVVKVLRFVRLMDASYIHIIPKHLFEQVEGRSWSVDRFYKYAPAILSSGTNCFWALVDEDNSIKGILWVVIDILSQKLNVIVFSVDKEYQHESDLEMARDFLRQYIEDFNKTENGITLKETINWVTTDPDKFDDIGGRLPKTVMVEV